MSLRVSSVAFKDTTKTTESKTTEKSAAQQPVEKNTTEAAKTNFIKDNLSLINSGLILVSLGVGTAALIKGKGSKELVEKTGTQMSKIDEKLGLIGTKVSDMARQVTTITTEHTNLSSSITNLTTKAGEAQTKLGALEKEIASKAEYHDGYLKALDGRVKGIESIRDFGTAPTEPNLAAIDGIPLMQNLNNDGNRIPLKASVIEWLKTATDRFVMSGKGQIKPKPLTKDSVVWSVTSESLPEKEGGLGEVPIQIAKNLKNEFGIDNPIVRPLVQSPGKAQLIEKNGKFVYRYNINSNKPWSMDLTKVVEFETTAFRNGRLEPQKVEVFYGIDPEHGHARIMFKNDTYFTSNGLYTNTQMVSEPERFAFLDRITYDFMKLKKDPNSFTNYRVFDTATYDSIKAPDALILNDWHPGGVAALVRLKSACEASNGELSQDAAEAFKSMNILNIVHNLDYQGTAWGNRKAAMMNTLFDKYAYDIHAYAETGFGYDGINKVLTTGDQVNLANMAACLSNKMKPVSPTYARELAEQPVRSRAMQHVCEVRMKQGTMEGQSNGWDRSAYEVSVDLIDKFNNAINNDKITIIKTRLKEAAKDLSQDQRERLFAIINDKSFDGVNLTAKLADIKDMHYPALDEAIKALDDEGITKVREIFAYTYQTPKETIMENRKHNKQMLVDFFKSMIQHNKTTGKDVFNLGELHQTNLSDININELDDTIVFNMGVRFVSQKGVDTACYAIKNIMKGWKAKYPDKPLPIWFIGGADAEGGRINSFVVQLKNALGTEYGSRVVHQVGYTQNNIYQAGSDFTLYSGHFEPDGAKWESLYKGTPAICTRVGGQVDSINDGVNGFLTSRTIPEIQAKIGTLEQKIEAVFRRNKGHEPSYEQAKDIAAKELADDYLREIGTDFTDAIWRAANTYYNKPAYEDMVMNSLNGNQSWVIKDGNGKITGGALLGHMKDLGFELEDFAQIRLNN